MSRLKDNYNSKVKEKLMKDLKMTNTFAVPKIKKTVINVGVGESIINKKAVEKVEEPKSENDEHKQEPMILDSKDEEKTGKKYH